MSSEGGGGVVMSDPHNPQQERMVWPSGVGGMQCEECGETTVVRRFGDWEDGEQWLCRECVESIDDWVTVDRGSDDDA